jgi:hypothetical protein
MKAKIKEDVFNCNNIIVLNRGDIVTVIPITYLESSMFVSHPDYKLPICVQISNLEIIEQEMV